ncbi:MAG: FAD-binding oxidoreductase [Gemmatimonadaceae bacterium]|nr:FAD-binding oxidoreductase [Gemmatimonadaceae bacterium]
MLTNARPNHSPTQLPTPSPPSDFCGVFRSDALARDLYAECAGIARVVPRAVAVPADADDLGRLVRWARQEGLTLIPRGSGSGMAGGALGDGVIVDCSRFTTIGPINVSGRRVRVGTGALRGDIDRAARAEGLTFPVDPSSGAFCTIGGMIAANAAGARSLRYGATRPWVAGVRCVFDDGSVAWVHRDEPLPLHVPAVARLVEALATLAADPPTHRWRRPGVRKDSSGYAIGDATATEGHLVDLLVGSEGTLACFVEAELLLASVPFATASLLASFPSLEASTVCATGAVAAGAGACELLDRTFLDVAARAAPTGVAAEAEAVLLIAVEASSDGELAVAVSQLSALCSHAGALQVTTAHDAEAEHALWALRHAVSPMLSRLAPRVRSMQFIEDGCVPPERFPDYVRGVRAALAATGITGVIFGHAGDAHAHVNPLVDVTQPGWRERMHSLLVRVTELTAQLGGTMAGEHGDGRLRAALADRVWDAGSRAAFAMVKHAADPHGVLNRGCKLAVDERAPGLLPTEIKYDPEAAPLDPRARAALDDIERLKKWDRYRLSAV